jgi:predicted nucleotidyltransferase
MTNIFNTDFQDFIAALNSCAVDYILVGGYSVILHGYSRTTGDMDIWVKATSENYLNLVNAFSTFGMPLFDMTKEKFLKIADYDVFTFGRPPVSIDIITQIKGLIFDDVFPNAEWFDITATIKVRVLHLNDLIIAKKAAGRNKDLDDLEHLQS